MDSIFTPGLMILVACGCFAVAVALAWICRVAVLSHGFLRMAADVLEGGRRQRAGALRPYGRDEMRGTYHGRDIVLGIAFAGIKGELMTYPHIALRLRKALGYNLNRLPHYAAIEKGYVVYRMRASGILGVFEKNYPEFFCRKTLIMALDRLVAAAEDLERGRTYGEVFT
ncbi:MAG: hypothetical protein ACM3L6_02320 [Deltaproteobacteria bacterium]